MKQLQLMLMAILAVFGRLFAFRAKAAQGGGDNFNFRGGNNFKPRGGGNFNFRRVFVALCLSAAIGAGNVAFAKSSDNIFDAARIGYQGWVTHHIIQGKSPDSALPNGRTLLHIATKYDHPDVVKELIKRGADFRKREEYGKTPLHFAAGFGRPEIIKILLNAGADIEAKDRDGRTPLHWAVFEGKPIAAEVLVKAGADNSFVNGWDNPRIQYRYLFRHLHNAAADDKPKVVEALIKAGADIELQAGLDFTPLHAAAFHNGPNAARVLIEAGANIDAINSAYITADGEGGEKPLDTSIRMKTHEVERVIREEMKRRADIEREKEHQRWLALSRHEKWNECVPKHGHFLCMFWKFGW